MDEIRPIEEIRELVKNKNELQPEKVTKELGKVNINDICFTVDKSKSFEQQAEDIVAAMATAAAINDENTTKDITAKKSEELIAKAQEKEINAETNRIKAETERQEAIRGKNEAVLETFGIKKQLPKWLLQIMVVMFSPIYILLTIIIGVPCGVVKVLIDNIDNILVRYESAEDTNRPKIKIAVWIILTLGVLATATFIILKCLNKI